MKKAIIIFLTTCTLMISTGLVREASAQCPMCKMAAESNLKNGGTAGKGLNAGIFYMLAMPYVIIGTIGYIWYRNQRKEEEDENIPERQF